MVKKKLHHYLCYSYNDRHGANEKRHTLNSYQTSNEPLTAAVGSKEDDGRTNLLTSYTTIYAQLIKSFK